MISTDGAADFPGRSGPTATAEADPHDVGQVRTSYAPDRDGDPDPGEIVWTWVPFEESDGRGKDRPVLVVAREAAGTLLAVQLSSKQHDREREWVALGAGPWDSSVEAVLGRSGPGAAGARGRDAPRGVRAGPGPVRSGRRAAAGALRLELTHGAGPTGRGGCGRPLPPGTAKAGAHPSSST